MAYYDPHKIGYYYFRGTKVYASWG